MTRRLMIVVLLAVAYWLTGCPKSPDGSVDWEQSYANYKEAQRERCRAQLTAHEVAVASGVYEMERQRIVESKGDETAAQIEAALAASRAICRLRLSRSEPALE